MTQEEKELLLKDICCRLPYMPKIKITYQQQGIEGTDEGNVSCDFIEKIVNDLRNGVITDMQIYLRPMSSMTEEEAMEIAILHDIKDILSVKVTSDYIEVIVDDGVCSTERRTIWYDEMVSSIKCFDWLNAHHFDYRGLIEKGLAIVAPEGMYK